MYNELVSIISPVYNGGKYIANFLDSVLNQTYSNIELIIIDDGSTDNTESIIAGYEERFEEKNYTLKYVKQSENKGQAAAINVGLKMFQGEYVMWMDSDDILYPNAIQDKVDFLRENKELDFVLNKGEIVSVNDLEKQIGVLERIKPMGEDKLFQDLLEEKNVVYGPASILVRAQSLRNAIPDLHIFESREGQNWQLMLPLAHTCKYGYLNKILFKYVVHDDSHSHMKRDFDEEYRRRENFNILQRETINKIPGMSDDEKKHWLDLSHKIKLYSQYVVACRYHKYRVSRELARNLKECGVRIPFRQRYFILDIFNFASRVKNKIKRVINNKVRV